MIRNNCSSNVSSKLSRNKGSFVIDLVQSLLLGRWVRNNIPSTKRSAQTSSIAFVARICFWILLVWMLSKIALLLPEYVSFDNRHPHNSPAEKS